MCNTLVRLGYFFLTTFCFVVELNFSNRARKNGIWRFFFQLLSEMQNFLLLNVWFSSKLESELAKATMVYGFEQRLAQVRLLFQTLCAHKLQNSEVYLQEKYKLGGFSLQSDLLKKLKVDFVLLNTILEYTWVRFRYACLQIYSHQFID